MQINDLFKLNYYNPIKSSNNVTNNSSNVTNNSSNVNGMQTINSNEQTAPIRNVIMPTEGTVYSGGNAAGLSFELRYAESSTDENPVMTARGWDENGDEFERTININNIDPQNATPVEITALQAHLNGGKLYLTSGSSMVTSGNHGDNIGLNLNDRNDYITPLKNNINVYGNSGYPGTKELALDLSIILDRLSAFMNKEEITNADK